MFAVHRPKFISFDGDESELGPATVAFFRGVEQHEKGSEVWDAHLDESL